MKTLVFDIGGTNLRYAIGPGRLSPVKVNVPNYQDVITVLSEVAKKNKIRSIAGGLPGTLNKEKTGLIVSTHLPKWVGCNFVKDLSKSSKAKVNLENDSALVALGEAHYGPGRGYGVIAYIGIGTGIGGARIVNGRIDTNAHGFEPGHHIIDWNIKHHQHPSPHPGDWESLISGSGIFYQTGQRSEFIQSKKIWNEMEWRVAIGLINVSMFWSPDVIILGGSLMKKLTIAGIKKHFDRHMKIFPNMIRIKKASLGDFGGLYGALALAKKK